jgi:hypothetical protein
LVKTTNKDLMYVSLDVVNVWHHVILYTYVHCAWIAVQADPYTTHTGSHDTIH